MLYTPKPSEVTMPPVRERTGDEFLTLEPCVVERGPRHNCVLKTHVLRQLSHTPDNAEMRLRDKSSLSDALIHVFAFLKSTSYVMCQNIYFSRVVNSAHNLLMFDIYLRTNSDFCLIQPKLIGFHNRDEKCLQRGTDWVFK